MTDLAIAFGILAALSVGLFALTAWAARGWGPSACNIAALAVVVLLFVYIHTVWDDVRIAQLLPYSNLIVLGNWLPLFAAAMAGLAWQRAQGQALRQLATVGALFSASAFATAYPLLGTTPECGYRWDNLGTCLQTTEQTCSPAAAAMLLSRHGIPATEQELAELCLTRRGTTWQGLYRGLKLKTQGTAWDVEVCRCEVDELQRLCGTPALLSVGLDRGSSRDTDYERELGWIPGVSHSVVLERYQRDLAVIADPSQESMREHWDDEMLRTLWRGYAFRLVPRK
jgi:hypothetical protein